MSEKISKKKLLLIVLLLVLIFAAVFIASKINTNKVKGPTVEQKLEIIKKLDEDAKVSPSLSPGQKEKIIVETNNDRKEIPTDERIRLLQEALKKK